MNCVIFAFFLLCAVCNNGVSFGAKLPDGFLRCKVSELTDHKRNHCLEEAMNRAIRYLSINGDRDLGLPDLDPLKVNEISISQGDVKGPVALEMSFKNVDVYGIADYKVKSVTGKVSSPKDFLFTVDGTIDRLKLLGEYSMNGKILILPVKGTGACNLTLDGVRAGGTIIGEPFIKHGKEYLKVKNFKMTISLSRAYLQFENLFGDKVLSSNMNKFMNENWVEIYKELRPYIEDAVGKVFQAYSRRILERIQYKNIFIVE